MGLVDGRTVRAALAALPHRVTRVAIIARRAGADESDVFDETARHGPIPDPDVDACTVVRGRGSG